VLINTLLALARSERGELPLQRAANLLIDMAWR
jgi:hypothetical protein